MEYTLVIIYAIVNIIFFCFLLRKRSLFTPGMVVVAFYVLVAVLAIPAYDLLPKDDFFGSFDFSNITILPYMFYILASFILIKPIFSYDRILHKYRVYGNGRNIKLFVYLFTFFSMMSIYVYARMIVENSIFENLDLIRQDNYEGEQIKAYHNAFEHLALLFTHYFAFPAKILLFYILTNQKSKPRIPGVFLLFCIGSILPGIMDASRTASRVMAVNVIIELLLCYSIFRKSFSRKVRIVLYSAFAVFCAIMITYTYMVTEARFGNQSDNSTFTSLVCYLGQPTLIFNSQVAAINEFAWGARFFYPLLKLLGERPDLLLGRISKGWDVCFSTLVGDLWQDFSIFVFIIIPVIAFGIQKWVKSRKSLGIAEIYLMTYYANTILRGALVTGYGMCLDLTVVLVIYILMRVFFSEKI